MQLNDYGINLVESKGKDDIAEFDENEQSNSIKHLDGNEAYDYLTKEVFSQLNNENTKFLKIPSNLVTDMPLEKDDERKLFVSIKLPSYMQERDGFKFANAQFYANKAFHVINDKHDLRAIPCYDKVLSGENAGKDVFFKVSNYDKEIEVKATDLFNYNKEDFSKFLNNQKKTDNSNGIKDENNGKVPKTEEKSNTNTNTKKSENSMS